MCSASTHCTFTRSAVVHARVLERLVHRQVRVVELHVLADERDRDRAFLRADSLLELEPLAELGRRHLEPQTSRDELVEPLGLQRLRHEVDVAHVRVRDHGVRLDVGEERDLVADVLGDLLARPADDHVGVDTDAAQLVDGVLRRLRLQLAGRVDERHERHVDVADVLDAGLAPELPDRLEERQRLDVADGPADLRDHDVDRLGLGDPLDPRLDLVRDVRDHLHGRAEELALALLAQHGVPDPAGRVRGVAREVLVDEALVVADVEVGLGAVLGDEDLAVLERRHRAGIDVQVRVELLRLNAQAARLQQPSERRGDDPLAETGDHSTRHEHILGRARGHLGLPPEGVELAQDRRPLDQLTE